MRRLELRYVVLTIKSHLKLPDSWIFVRLKHLGTVIGGGTPKTTTPSYWDGNIPWLTPADLSGYTAMYVSSGERKITQVGLN